jgi:hypothetical protein
MPLFVVHVSLAGLRNHEVDRLDRLMRKLNGSAGKIEYSADGLPVRKTYYFSTEHRTNADEFRRWLDLQIWGRFNRAIELRIETISRLS